MQRIGFFLKTVVKILKVLEDAIVHNRFLSMSL